MADETKAVTIYARLMEAGCDAPQAELREFIGDRVERFAGGLTSELVEQLRQAYTAGVADGFRQAVMEQEKVGEAFYPDPQKLRLLADWFDSQQPARGWDGTEVQDDLRRWADALPQGDEESTR